MMKEILITSSALILALLVIRQAFKGVLSRRFQYALWALVLVRLLVPVSLPAAEFSVMTAAQPVQAAVAERTETMVYAIPTRNIPDHKLEPGREPVVARTVQNHLQDNGEIRSVVTSSGYVVDENGLTEYAFMLSWKEILSLLWIVGMVLMGAFFLVSNGRFYLRLRKNREAWTSPRRTKRKVYLVPDGALPSPCLFGRSIYITPAVAADESKLRHVLCHEETHAKHWDPLWSLLRCLCLTVYWFDPLVWVAAVCSKTDCELACDESVLDALGEAERIPYGQTLVSLIPVKRVGNPMIAATTMTAGKKQLRDRVTRIARRPRQLVAAALAVAVLAGVVSACTFTGGKGETTPEPGPSQGPAESTVRSLTGEELRWFNEEFFNNFNSVISYTYNIRNQFANPLNLYERPEDIDLYELFYLEGRAPTNQELRAYGVEDEADLVCPVYVITAGEMEELLGEYTGLSLEDFDRESLGYEYVEAVDTYFNMHGDTNYCGNLDFVCGTREGGTVKLYHHSDFAGGGWYCVTLADRRDEVIAPYGDAAADGTEGESRYWFVSNVACERPVIPTPLPAWEPETIVSLKDLTPYKAPAVTVETHVGDFDNSYKNRLENWNFDGHNVVAYRSTDGNIYAAVRREDGAMDVFHTLSDEDFSLFFYNDLLGRDGFTVTYRPEVNIQLYPTDTDYYYFDENGTPALLARCHEECLTLDLDGDGQDELVTPWQLFFQREGVVYEARLDELLQAACPELTYWDHSLWDKYGKCLYVSGLSGEATWERYVYFDGEDLLVYKNEKPTHDHMVDGAEEGVPAAVAEEARDYVERLYIEAELKFTTAEAEDVLRRADLESEGEQTAPGELPPEYDDWRIDYFDGPYTYSYGGATVEGWWFNYELHTLTPERVVLAGGRYITEDNWVSPGYPRCDALFFEVRGDGTYRLLSSGMVQENPESDFVRRQVIRMMRDGGVELADGYSYALLEIAGDLEQILDHSGPDGVRLQLDGRGGGDSYTVRGEGPWDRTEPYNGPGGWSSACRADPQEGYGPYCRARFTAPENYRWTRVGAPSETPEGYCLTLARDDWSLILRFWEDSELVMRKGDNEEPVWYRAEALEAAGNAYDYRDGIFYLMRGWFDEVELERYANTALGDHGDGNYREVVSAYLALYEGAKLNVSPGSRYACSYGKVTDVEILEDQPESWFPAGVLDYPHFAFSYDFIFVPENEEALNNLMAGNTGNYEGDDPYVPEGAFQYSRLGSMYLVDGYWYCGGIGTG